MSIIAAKIDRKKHTITIASDSICLMGSEKYTCNKISQIDDDFIVGGAGEYTANQLLFNNLYNIYKHKQLNVDENNLTTESFLYHIFKQAYLQTVEDRKIGVDSEWFDFDYLVFYKNKLYKIFTSFYDENGNDSVKTLEVLSIDKDYLAVGSGQQFVTCAMRLGKSPEQAIKIANEFENNIDGNINVITLSFYD